MSRRTKRILLGIGATVLVLVGTPVIAIAITMAGDSPLKEGDLGTHEKQVASGFVSVGFVDTGAGIALVDCAQDKEAKAILAELERRKLGADDVKAIFLTHGHGDHTDGCARFPRAEVYALASETDLIEGRATPKAFLPKMFGVHDSGVRVKHPLADGDVVTLGDVKIEAFALPGHTQGSAVYLIDGVVHFGDGANANKDGAITPAKYLFSDDQKEDIESLKKLAARLEPRAADVKTLEFAHTGTLPGFDPLRAFAKAR
jgi:glyoxylase-like metal-dependent hydrolase (beta-lactamase superfamily II)